MKNSIRNKFLFTIVSFVITTIAFVPRANAEDLVITGNGAGSSNTINITSDSSTNIQQSNTANITNEVNTTADTGNNTTNNNSGNSTTTTGDASQTTNITNDTNTSVVDQSCCVSPTPSSEITISGNGAGSDNNADVTTNSQTTVVINQTATITNTVTETANTGNNTANNNTGNVSIQTGDIVSKKTINNDPVNSTHVSVSDNNSTGNTKIKIFGNGEGSDNNVAFGKNNITQIFINNSSYIKNDITSDLNTGNNHADKNTGDVTIRTGDIISEITIDNDLNRSWVDLGCCELPKPEDQDTNPEPEPIKPIDKILPPPPPPSKPVPPEKKSDTSNPPTQTGQVAAATTSILPVTGNNLMFFIFISNILMLLLGAYLRLRSGNSPGSIASI